MMEHIAKVYRRVINVITNGIQTAPVTQRNGVAYVQIQANAFSTAEYPMMQHYGFSSIPLNGALHYKIAMAGDKSNAVSIGSNDSRYRPPSMAAGDVQLYNNNGVSVWLQNASVSIFIAGNLVASFDASGLDITGQCTTTGNVVAGTGATGSFTTPTGQIVTVQDGIITNIF